MNVLIKQARIYDPQSPENGKRMDILIENGVIKSIKTKIQSEKSIKTIESDDLCISPGWLDIQVDLCDPGMEQKEDLESGLSCAAAGGFTGVAPVPSTHPPVSSKAQVQYLVNKSSGNLVDVYPLGTVTNKREGQELAELYDMQLAGAVAFTDDKRTVANPGLLMRALLYSKNFNGLVMSHCNDKNVSADGQMNEGEQSTRLGLKGMPALAEELMVVRNIFLAEYTDAPLHISNLSTKKSVELVRQAKSKGLKISASVNAYNLVLTDQELAGFDSNFKLDPPLRTKSDVDALRKGLADGTIDAITSDHRPQDIESKELEFDLAGFGMIGLETTFALLNSERGKMTLEQILSGLSTGPRKVLRLKEPVIKEGEMANVTLFDPTTSWTFNLKKSNSKSANSPFDGKKFSGKVIGVINKNKLHLNS